MRRLMMMAVVALLGVFLLAPPAMAEEEGHAVIVWVGTVATNIGYIPVKCVHAAMGGLIGSLGWLVTGCNPTVADAVFDHTIYSSWFVTPEMLEGKEPLLFFGAE